MSQRLFKSRIALPPAISVNVRIDVALLMEDLSNGTKNRNNLLEKVIGTRDSVVELVIDAMLRRQRLVFVGRLTNLQSSHQS